ncbi:DUF397 domain-containing protein [Saccharopolyspora sp. 5N102]|uniref:DUF397 domain-containing protein n=1 Tax=Saccharopolyspora sp. 5N102 TaxID=3375155 RepID=UPI003796430A
MSVDLSNAKWRKSSRSGGGGDGSCVEVAFAGPAVAVRDSKDPGGPVLAFSASSWSAFLRQARR